MQEGLLFHGLYDAAKRAYFEQTGYRLHGALDPARFEAAWKLPAGAAREPARAHWHRGRRAAGADGAAAADRRVPLRRLAYACLGRTAGAACGISRGGSARAASISRVTAAPRRRVPDGRRRPRRGVELSSPAARRMERRDPHLGARSGVRGADRERAARVAGRDALPPVSAVAGRAGSNGERRVLDVGARRLRGDGDGAARRTPDGEHGRRQTRAVRGGSGRQRPRRSTPGRRRPV